MSGLDRAALLRLREEFDRAFEKPAGGEAPAVEDVLWIHSGRAALAVRRSELAWIGRTPPLTPLPTRVTELAGVGDVHGRLLPVYRLHRLLDLPDADEGGWLLVPRGTPRVGLTFARFDGQRAVPPEALLPGASGPALTAGAVRLGNVVLPLIDLSATLRRVEAVASPSTGE